MPATVQDCVEYFKHLAQNAAAWIGSVPKCVGRGGGQRAQHTAHAPCALDTYGCALDTYARHTRMDALDTYGCALDTYGCATHMDAL